MTRPGWKPLPYAVKEIVSIAVNEVECKSRGATPGLPCVDPGEDREVHGGRWAKAAMTRRRRRQAAKLTAEQRAALAALPRLPREVIEECRTPDGDLNFTESWFRRHDLPWPPIAGWRRAVEGREP